jgi:hypothetical protein
LASITLLDSFDTWSMSFIFIGAVGCVDGAMAPVGGSSSLLAPRLRGNKPFSCLSKAGALADPLGRVAAGLPSSPSPSAIGADASIEPTASTHSGASFMGTSFH